MRAVRLATELEFEIEPRTLAAIVVQPSVVMTVSAERITTELQRILIAPDRDRGLQLLVDTGLLQAILPECGWSCEPAAEWTELTFAQGVLKNLVNPSFAAALATLLRHKVTSHQQTKQLVRGVCRRLKTNNADEQLAIAMLQNEQIIRHATSIAWSELQPVLTRRDADALIDFVESVCRHSSAPGLEAVQYCRHQRQLPGNELDPSPLLTGDDLKTRGFPPGPTYARLLKAVLAAQLDKSIGSMDEAWKLVESLMEGAGE